MIQAKEDIINYIEECEKTNVYLMTLAGHVNYIHSSFLNNQSQWEEFYSSTINKDPIKLYSYSLT
jgi:hypothetical protein